MNPATVTDFAIQTSTPDFYPSLDTFGILTQITSPPWRQTAKIIANHFFIFKTVSTRLSRRPKGKALTQRNALTFIWALIQRQMLLSQPRWIEVSH